MYLCSTHDAMLAHCKCKESRLYPGRKVCSFCIAGYNVCIFAYGQTGSGKTHTMAGSNIEEYSGRGINYRALDDLFAINEERQGEVCTRLLS